jgi:carbamoyltransferase
MTAILGISALYHDSAAALVIDGRIAAAAQEERFTRVKYDERFPAAAIEFCLRHAGLRADDLDYVVFYEKPLIKLDRLVETYLAHAPFGFRSFTRALPRWTNLKLHIRRIVRDTLRTSREVPLVFVEHHESHAASAFFPSPFDEAAILTLDGVGEWTTGSAGRGSGNRLTIEETMQFPHSLGMLYSAFTYYCGFKVNSGEYKLMGLAPFGSPVYADAIRRHLLDVKSDGSFRLNLDYFDYCAGLHMTNRRFNRLFGGDPLPAGGRLEQRHADLAASVQAVTEEIILRLADSLHRRCKARHLVMAGGVALNAVANGRLLREGPFDDVWIQPAPGDAGGAIGGALFVWHQLLGNARQNMNGDRQSGSFLGPEFSEADAVQALQARGLPFEVVSDAGALHRQVAETLGAQRVVGWFQGRMEFGPRALGARSILADARSPHMKSVLNLKVKFRESFRPFAPVVLREHAGRWFDTSDRSSPYMLFVFPLLEERRQRPGAAEQRAAFEREDLIEQVNLARSSIPAVTHVDYSARVQTVDRSNPNLYPLLTEFHRQTGCPVLVNTSFNVRGEPIVCTPEDAVRCFVATEIDILVMGNVIARKNLSADELVAAREAHMLRHSPD